MCHVDHRADRNPAELPGIVCASGVITAPAAPDPLQTIRVQYARASLHAFGNARTARTAPPSANKLLYSISSMLIRPLYPTLQKGLNARTAVHPVSIFGPDTCAAQPAFNRLCGRQN